MYFLRSVVGALMSLFLLFACAADPKLEAAREEKSLQVARILSETSDYSEPRRCLRSHEYRNFEILDDRRIIFSGSRDKRWLNQLRGTCPGLRTGHALKFVSRTGMSQICDLDSFEVVDFFYYPRFRRWPWDWFDGVRCTLGKFEPITEQQAESLKLALKP
jgi:uncharacterized protein DUF6491